MRGQETWANKILFVKTIFFSKDIISGGNEQEIDRGMSA